MIRHFTLAATFLLCSNQITAMNKHKQQHHHITPSTWLDSPYASKEDLTQLERPATPDKHAAPEVSVTETKTWYTEPRVSHQQKMAETLMILLQKYASEKN